VQASENSSRAELYRLRANLVRTIDPLRSNGADLQDEIMKCVRQAISE
jgi:RNA polymerase sigma-70 factor, ECF subfamily